jgi:hypothetical protein
MISVETNRALIPKFSKHFLSKGNYFRVDYYFRLYQTPKNIKNNFFKNILRRNKRIIYITSLLFFEQNFFNHLLTTI